jgi:NADP-dependent 3-hydroxy acid dehydrogenase YdfG
VQAKSTVAGQIKKLANAEVQTYRRIDVMINTAGLMRHSPLERLSSSH